ncbi:MAG: NAD(P)H-dependent oxidoreductase, partial [Lactobacillus iners]|nr:NAD(P)H-dependent oxidoreductase [Lactobacillus iners]
LPANEILIGYAATNFDKQSHDLINKTIIKQLDVAMDNFYQFINQWNK